MPCSQVLETEEAVPIPCSTPTGIVLDYLQRKEGSTEVEEMSTYTRMTMNLRLIAQEW
jgi:hypothetical protein